MTDAPPRIEAKKAPRTFNYEIGRLRGILRHVGLWGAVSDRLAHLRETHDGGWILTRADEEMLLAAVRESRSHALLPLFTCRSSVEGRRNRQR